MMYLLVAQQPLSPIRLLGYCLGVSRGRLENLQWQNSPSWRTETHIYGSSNGRGLSP